MIAEAPNLHKVNQGFGFRPGLELGSATFWWNNVGQIVYSLFSLFFKV